MIAAIQYAQKYFSSWAETHMREIQHAMALLSYNPHTRFGVYSDLFSNARWEQLIAQFRQDNFALNALTAQPLLKMALQAGLSALKTPTCYQMENKNVHCPVCDTNVLGPLADHLPYAHQVNSVSVCRISGAIMNEDNPPMVLPNGQVYSKKVSFMNHSLNRHWIKWQHKKEEILPVHGPT
jgi:macrophage erythroblast attacher